MSDRIKPPLHISAVRTRLGGEPVLQIIDVNGGWFASVFYSDKTPEQHAASYADANLIVRAVNSHQALVEALEACVTELSAYYDGVNDESADDDEALSKASEALKLAKG